MLYSFLYWQWLTKSYHIINSQWISAKRLRIPSPGGAYRKQFRQYSQRTHNMGHITVCVIAYSSVSHPELTKRSRLQVPIKWPRVLNTLIQVDFFKCYNNKVSIDSGISASSHDETRIRFTLLPQKITRLDNIYKKFLFRHRTVGNAWMTAICGSRETNKWALHRKHSLPRRFPAHCMGKKIPNRVQ